MMPSAGMSFLVPDSYEALQKQYGKYLEKLLQRHNKVEANFEDLHSYVWVKLLEAKILERFEEHVSRLHPKVLTAIEACILFGVTWTQWSEAMTSFHTQGEGRWMPLPINEAEFAVNGGSGITSRDALFAYTDLLQMIADAPGFEVFPQQGQDIDSEGNAVAASRQEGLFKIPDYPVTQSFFKNYLNRSALNHYANFCRTLNRRHKERPHTDRANDKGDAPVWESTLVDYTSAPADVIAELAEARAHLASVLSECFESESADLSPQAHEAEIFGALSSGASLTQALKASSMPPRVRKAVLNALSHQRPANAFVAR